VTTDDRCQLSAVFLQKTTGGPWLPFLGAPDPAWKRHRFHATGLDPTASYFAIAVTLNAFGFLGVSPPVTI
jgi:hypothetical protein